ncbi:MAG: 4Fe-4S dicluster domain-containing protein [Actinomycetes bacterium]
MVTMAILQEVDKCMRCNGCVTACKREWNLKLPKLMSEVIPQKSIVQPRQRLAIKSLRRGDMGPHLRYSCWHCPDAPCIKECPRGAIKQEATGAVSVDNAKCDPTQCKIGGPKPCEIGCQQGGYPKVGEAYESGPYSGTGVTRMNKCTLCTGRAGADTDPNLNASTALPTRQTVASGTYPNQVWYSPIRLSVGTLPNPTLAELAHEPACVSTCPAKAMRWDSKANILAYLNDPANGFILPNGTQNWYGSGSMYWVSKNTLLVPPKADPFIEDHITPLASNVLAGSGKFAIPALVLGGFAVVSMRRAKIEEESSAVSVREV